MESDAIFDRIFKMLYGKPCWNVKPGYGSFLTLEFGKPHLQIHEPRKPRPDASLTVGSLLSRRHPHSWRLASLDLLLRMVRLVGLEDRRRQFVHTAHQAGR